jgi:hypothetical protein
MLNKNEKFLEDFKIINQNKILDAGFVKNIEQYRQWLLPLLGFVGVNRNNALISY